MNYKKIFKSRRCSIFLAASLVMISSTASAVDLAAVPSTWTSTTGTLRVVPMWGFVTDTGSCPVTPPAWDLGPTLTAADLVGTDLTINLRNCLTEPVSIVIPGQTPFYTPPTRNLDGRIVAFSHEAPADMGATTTAYTWLNVDTNTGAFLYQSGSHVAKQVHMGLYGVLKVGDVAGASREITLVYSDIDPDLHDSESAATPLTYKPSYFLLNGKEQHEPILAGDLIDPTAINFLNAGLDFHVPALEGDYMLLEAEDGNAYPNGKEQYSVNLAAGKTIEASWAPAGPGEYPLFDRRGHGMPVKLVVVNDVAEPFAQNDHYGLVNNHGWVDPPGVVQDQISISAADGVLANDYQLPGGPTVVLASGPSEGDVTCESPPGPGLCADGSFIYTPTTAGFNGPDTFMYNIVGFIGSQGTVTIDVNAGPLAEDLLTAVWRKSKPGKKDKGDPNGTDRNTINLLDYVSDMSKVDPASIEIIGMNKKNNGQWKPFKTANKGTVKNKGNGKVTYKPKDTYVGSDSFTYIVKDVQGAISNVGTVSINVVKKLSDLPPLI